MRTIEFRGKRLADTNWVYGSLVLAKNGVFILQPNHPDYLLQRIDKETVSQFTGLLDKNGQKVFEGDIVEWNDRNYSVEWNVNGYWNFRRKDKFLTNIEYWESKIIGNIHDH